VTASKPALLMPPGHGRTFMIGAHQVIEKITSEQSGGDYYVIQQVSPPGAFVPPHVHTLEDEIVLVEQGELEVHLGGSLVEAKAGTVLNFARGTYHGFRNAGTTPAHTTWIITPGASFQAFFHEVAKFPPGPPDVARLDELHARHGIMMPAPSA
jgi:quercetin dioxygenase-like cupin family protein